MDLSSGESYDEMTSPMSKDLVVGITIEPVRVVDELKKVPIEVIGEQEKGFGCPPMEKDQKKHKRKEKTSQKSHEKFLSPWLSKRSHGPGETFAPFLGVKSLEDAHSHWGSKKLSLSTKVSELTTEEKRLCTKVEGLQQNLIDMTLSHHIEQVQNEWLKKDF
ncbi:hypothetical protein VNO80_23136 [Phaseolus coccineus]|uniref:Uncharacterized protein n=1 Tax=Phaseolus coccineus TaxID=3886 RepID=A0AAN9QVK5_PHACN